MIEERLEQVREKILLSCQKSGRQLDEVKLIAVTKKVNVDDIQKAISCGLTLFGENRVQEAESKIQALSNEHLQWHFIGRLQGNKIPKVIKYFQCIHSLDRESHVLTLGKRLEIERLNTYPVFVQVNLTGSPNQGGVEKEKIFSLLESIRLYSHIQVIGLMTIGPQGSEDEIREVFQELYHLKEKIENKKYNWVSPSLELSMGMSDDYHIAVEEGATYLRLGRCLFGERSY